MFKEQWFSYLPDKCQFGFTELDFLGHINKEGTFPMHSKVEAIQNFVEPSTMKEMYEFVGLLNFYNRFIPQAAQLMVPLYATFSGTLKTAASEWNEELVEAFSKAKKAITEATMLTHPFKRAPIPPTVDASDVAMGALLQQAVVVGSTVSLAFFSHPETL